MIHHKGHEEGRTRAAVGFELDFACIRQKLGVRSSNRAKHRNSVGLLAAAQAFAFTLANEARRLTECDRVKVAFWNGRMATIQALCGQDIFDSRANAMRLLTNLVTAIATAGDSVWYDGGNTDLSPQVEAAAQEYADNFPARLVAMLPAGAGLNTTEKVFV